MVKQAGQAQLSELFFGCKQSLIQTFLQILKCADVICTEDPMPNFKLLDASLWEKERKEEREPGKKERKKQ